MPPKGSQRLEEISPLLAGLVINEASKSRNASKRSRLASVIPTSGTLSLPSESGGQPTTPDTPYGRSEAKVRGYETAVFGAIHRLKIKVALNASYYSVVIIVLGLALAFANIVGALTTVGLGGTSLFAKAGDLRDSVQAYLNDVNDLELSRQEAWNLLRNCSQKDEACLNKVNATIDEDFANLHHASAQSQTAK